MSKIFYILFRNLAAKLLIASVLTFGAQEANANLYRVNLTYGPDNDSDEFGTGTLSGVLFIDASQFDNQQNNTDVLTDFSPVPNWITSASLTLTGRTHPDELVYNRTYTSFSSMAFALATTAENPNPTFDPNSNFKDQLSRFGFSNAALGIGAPSGLANTFRQEAGQGEWDLLTTDTEAVPGPLPVLALAPLAYYYRKFKKKSPTL